MFAIGDWVRWHAKSKKRVIAGEIIALHGNRAIILWTTWDGKSHRWVAPLSKLRRVSLAPHTQQEKE